MLARQNLSVPRHARHESQQLISLRECLGKVLEPTGCCFS